MLLKREKLGEKMKKGRIISDISKRVLIVEGEEELKRILSIASREKNDNIVETKRLESIVTGKQIGRAHV